jgi:hypothetical protein
LFTRRHRAQGLTGHLGLARFVSRLSVTAVLKRCKTPASETASGVKWMLAMRVTIDLPADVSAALEERWNDVSRRAPEAVAVEGYRTVLPGQ